MGLIMKFINGCADTILYNNLAKLSLVLQNDKVFSLADKFDLNCLYLRTGTNLIYKKVAYPSQMLQYQNYH